MDCLPFSISVVAWHETLICILLRKQSALLLSWLQTAFLLFFLSFASAGPVLTPSFPQMQVQQLLQMKKQQAAAAAAAQQKVGQPQQGQAAVQQKVSTTTAEIELTIQTILTVFTISLLWSTPNRWLCRRLSQDSSSSRRWPMLPPHNSNQWSRPSFSLLHPLLRLKNPVELNKSR